MYMYVHVECKLELKSMRCNTSLRYHVSWSAQTDKENSIHDYVTVHTTVYNNIDVLFMV